MSQRVLRCPHCSNSDPGLIGYVLGGVFSRKKYYCEVCSKVFDMNGVADDTNAESKGGSKNTKEKTPEP